LPIGHVPEVLVGFDGFVDHIIEVVDKRTSPTAYRRVDTLSAFGAKVSAASGRSAGFGCVTTITKLGGNGPIMANALCAQGAAVVVVGNLGEATLDPVFQGLARKARRIISLGAPSVTSALEFDDGKLMLNFPEPMNNVRWEVLLDRCGGLDEVKKLYRTAQGVTSVNWSQTQGMTEIIRRIATEVLPGLRSDRPRWFVDLSDPNRRPAEDVRAVMAALRQIQAHADVILGLNENECRQMCAIYDVTFPAMVPEWVAAEHACVALREKLGLSLVMCHLVRSSACAWAPGFAAGAGGSTSADGFFCAKPKTTTGAGDHFNAGFFGGILAGLPLDQCLQIGGGTSGHFVRTGESPTPVQVAAFLREQVAVAGKA
jgi:hypothetical protein